MAKYAIAFKSPVTGIKNDNFGIKKGVKGIVCGKREQLLLCEPRIYDFSLLTCPFTPTPECRALRTSEWRMLNAFGASRK